jgi:hypothetical protein
MSFHAADSAFQRWAIGGICLIVSLVILYVSASMNYRFGFSLGKTEEDGLLYARMSVAADVFKALSPFLLYAAWRARRAIGVTAAVLLWLATTLYALGGALGHAGSNRLDTAGQRSLAADHYKDLRADLKRNQDQLAWIPAHRPPDTVKGEIESLKSKSMLLWSYSEECVRPDGAGQRKFCGEYHKLRGELGNAENAAKFNAKIDEISAKLADTKTSAATTESDPQASIISRMLVFVGVNLAVSDTQIWLTLLVVLLIEAGSGLGPYLSISYIVGFGVPAPAEQKHSDKVIDADYKDVPPTPLVTEPATGPAQGLLTSVPAASEPPIISAPGPDPEPPQQAAPEPLTTSARLPLPGSIASLEAIGFPLHARPDRRRDKSQPKESAQRFVVWLRAFDLVKEPLTDEDITRLYAEFCEDDYRHPTADNLLRGELKNVRGVNWSKPRQDGGDGTVKRQTRWMISRGKYSLPPPQPPSTKQEGVILAYPRPLAVPARDEPATRRAA